MILQINPYLTFNGNCREVMTFYKSCFGGELIFNTIGESPIADKLPPHMKENIMHASLKKDAFVLMASDMVGDHGLQKGNSVSIFLNFDSEDEIIKTYEKLSAGGKATHPLEITFWGAFFGTLTDKYGNHWLLNYNKNSNS